MEGTSDVLQFNLKGHSTQTNNILNVEKSDGTDLFSVTNENGTKIRGTTTNDAAASGNVGEEIIDSRASPGQTLITATPTNILALSGVSIPAGEWDVSGAVCFLNTTTTTTIRTAGINTTDAVFASYGIPASNQLTILDAGTTINGQTACIIIPPFRVSLSAAQDFFLNAQATFSTGSAFAYGHIRARRVR
jgi:hypothetical protein